MIMKIGLGTKKKVGNYNNNNNPLIPFAPNRVLMIGKGKIMGQNQKKRPYMHEKPGISALIISIYDIQYPRKSMLFFDY